MAKPAARAPIPAGTAAAMERRRADILREASRLLGAEGGGAFSLRKLAAGAGVTVPTVYNLVGNKDTILLELAGIALARFERELEARGAVHPLDMAEAVVLLSTRKFGEDEESHRAAHVALDQLRRTGTHADAYAEHDERCTQLQVRAIVAAKRAGLLRGRVDAHVLAHQIYRNYQQACQEWALGAISLDAFRDRGLLGVYLCLAADATDEFRATLLDRAAALEHVD